jgi:hypothetical protein
MVDVAALELLRLAKHPFLPKAEPLGDPSATDIFRSAADLDAVKFEVVKGVLDKE